MKRTLLTMLLFCCIFSEAQIVSKTQSDLIQAKKFLVLPVYSDTTSISDAKAGYMVRLVNNRVYLRNSSNTAWEAVGGNPLKAGTGVQILGDTIKGFSGNYLDLSNKPSFSTVARTGSYGGLTNTQNLQPSNSLSFDGLRKVGSTYGDVIDQFTHEPITYTKRTTLNDNVTAITDADVDSVMVQKSGPDYLVRNADKIDLRIFGAVGDATTDCYPALVKAISWVRKNFQAPFPFSVGYRTARPYIYIPNGTFYFSQGVTVDFADLTIKGAGANNTTLVYTGAAALFDIGVYTTTKLTSLFLGGAQGFSISDMAFFNPNQGGGENNTRVGAAIRDNGYGGLVINNVAIRQFKYGIEAVCGSDFDVINNLTISSCDVGCYFGPGTQQLNWAGGQISDCREGLVLDRVGQAVFNGLALMDNYYRQVTYESYQNKTRILDSCTFKASSMFLNNTFSNCWFETNSGNTTTLPQRWISFEYHTGVDEVYRNINFERPYLVAGSEGPAPTNTAFIAGTHSSNILLNYATYQGNSLTYIDSAVGMKIDNFEVANGYRSPILYADHAYYNSYNSFKRSYNSGNTNFSQEIINDCSKLGIRTGLLPEMIYQTWNGTGYVDRIGFDVQNRRLVFGTPDSAVAIGTGSDTTNINRVKGSITINTDAVNGSNLAWLFNGTKTIKIGILGMDFTGRGSPQNVLYAPAGSIYRDLDNGNVWLKKSGAADSARWVNDIGAKNGAWAGNSGSVLLTVNPSDGSFDTVRLPPPLTITNHVLRSVLRSKSPNIVIAGDSVDFKGDGGSYTPSIATSGNKNLTTAAPVPSSFNYLKVGNVVTVSGRLEVVATANNNILFCDFTLPFAPSATTGCSGTAVETITFTSGIVLNSISNTGFARLQCAGVNAGYTNTYFVHFTYTIN